MLLLLIDNKKGRSEALCLRIKDNRAVFAKGLYYPQNYFVPDNPELLNTNHVNTEGEHKIELGNKLFDILDCLNDAQQITLEEFAMGDNIDIVEPVDPEYEVVENDDIPKIEYHEYEDEKE